MAWLAWRFADDKIQPVPSSGLSSKKKLEDGGHGLEVRPGAGVLVIGETEEAEVSLVSSLQLIGLNSNILTLWDPIMQAFKTEASKRFAI